MIKLNLVDDIEKVCLPGDAHIVNNNGLLQLIMICPGCGKKSASAGKHIFDPVTLSYTPSIVHDVNLGGCGWHGWLTNGEFKHV